ncbi:helix-turn-helix domain-containing protein [Stenotrophobium rhamnosiphilum]|uniref:XRE family transcriptional regulator n=1 Tax=Stenotrophobium rhamnosiphilum TaxID=2029166 RepID=A0A2T5MAZ7_9GAMM|nr:helix-turn-helix transcriptional regulator [Stenotrophobium rhamnosiphilum]PTU27725.1 XRE family transcriptional regulator [Stenotrophobium rhamnosiphilum]
MPRSRKSRYADEYRVLLELLADARIASGITQVELSKKTGTSQGMLSKIERGVVRIDMADLLDYIDGIGADPIAFMTSYLKAIGWKPSGKKRKS